MSLNIIEDIVQHVSEEKAKMIDQVVGGILKKQNLPCDIEALRKKGYKIELVFKTTDEFELKIFKETKSYFIESETKIDVAAMTTKITTKVTNQSTLPVNYNEII